MKKKILYLICDREALRRWRSGGWADNGEIKTAHELWSVIGRVHELYKQGWADLTRWVIVEVDVSFLGAWNMGHGNWEFIAPIVPHDFGRVYPAYTVLV
jgi:hypothetical protein